MASPSTRERLQRQTALQAENQRLSHQTLEQQQQLQQQQAQIQALMAQLQAIAPAPVEPPGTPTGASAVAAEATAPAAAETAATEAAAETAAAEAAAEIAAADAEFWRAAAESVERAAADAAAAAAGGAVAVARVAEATPPRRRSLGSKDVVRSVGQPSPSSSVIEISPAPARWDKVSVEEHVRQYKTRRAPMIDFDSVWAEVEIDGRAKRQRAENAQGTSDGEVAVRIICQLAPFLFQLLDQMFKRPQASVR
jgi:DNA repair exonuclease SbcCD ATPase subunit